MFLCEGVNVDYVDCCKSNQEAEEPEEPEVNEEREAEQAHLPEWI